MDTKTIPFSAVLRDGTSTYLIGVPSKTALIACSEQPPTKEVLKKVVKANSPPFYYELDELERTVCLLPNQPSSPFESTK